MFGLIVDIHVCESIFLFGYSNGADRRINTLHGMLKRLGFGYFSNNGFEVRGIKPVFVFVSYDEPCRIILML